MKPIRLITLAPGHFHAALVQKQMSAGVHRRCHVYGPLDRDTLAHADRLAAFNTRHDDPTRWELDLRAGPDWLDRFQREQPGNTVVLSGRNRPKIDLIRAAVGCGLNVLADKPWIIESADLPKLEEAPPRRRPARCAGLGRDDRAARNDQPAPARTGPRPRPLRRVARRARRADRRSRSKASIT